MPDPLRFFDGRPVKTISDWKARRKEIGEVYQKYQLGTFPPKPKINHAVVLNEGRGKSYVFRNVRLEFGPQTKGTLRVRLVIPDGQGPFRVILNNYSAGWLPAVIRRDYIFCGYAANDFMDDAAPLDKLFRDYTFALLPRRAWAAGIVLDYLETLHLSEDVTRGVAGCMPSASLGRASVELWQTLGQDHERDRAFHRRLFPLLNFLMQLVEMLIACEKLPLVKCGMTSAAYCREPAFHLDHFHLAELD